MSDSNNVNDLEEKHSLSKEELAERIEISDDMETITIHMEDASLGIEIACGILGRAGDIHENPDNQFEHVAIKLRDIGSYLLHKYD